LRAIFPVVVMVLAWMILVVVQLLIVAKHVVLAPALALAKSCWQ